MKLNKGRARRVLRKVTWAGLNNLKVKNFAAAFKAFKYFNYVGFEFLWPGLMAQSPAKFVDVSVFCWGV